MWTDREGVAGVALLAMYADGVIAQEEDDVLRERLLEYPLFADLDDDGLGRVLERLSAASRERGAETMLRDWAAAIAPALRPTAFLIAAEIVAADGEVAPEEDDYLARAAKALELPPARSSQIVEVLAIRLRRG
jgi:uncharacterized tellurite resistance protein B-like protein